MQVLETIIALLLTFVPGVLYHYAMNYRPKDKSEGDQSNNYEI